MLGEAEQDLSGVEVEMPPKVRSPGRLFCLQPQACAGRRRGGKRLCDCVCVRAGQSQASCRWVRLSDSGAWFSDECD